LGPDQTTVSSSPLWSGAELPTAPSWILGKEEKGREGKDKKGKGREKDGKKGMGPDQV